MHLEDDNTLYLQASLPKFPGFSHPLTTSAYFSAWLLSFNLTFGVTDKKINLVKEKEIQNKYKFFVHGWAKKGAIMILHYNSALRYFDRKTTSIAFNSNWYNLASMLLCNVFSKPFYTWCLLTEISLLTDNSFQFSSSFKSDF